MNNCIPKEVNIMVIDYLNDENESFKLLELLEIDEKYYTSKLYHPIEFINIVKYRIRKILITERKQLYELYKIQNKITHIKFGKMFNQGTDELFKSFNKKNKNSAQQKYFPKYLTHLTFGSEFNQNVDNLPDGIKVLKFGDDFNRKVDNLPNSLTRLTFGNNFNQPVNKLPESLTHLIFGYSFNQLVDNLPNNITHLGFGRIFNKSVNNLPKKLTHLALGSCFSKEIDLNKYEKLEKIIVEDFEQLNLLKNIPLYLDIVIRNQYKLLS